MAIVLRSYQTAAVRELLKRLQQHRRVVAVAPTGSGKTTIAAALVRARKYTRVLWVAHRIELLRQARAELIAAGMQESAVGIFTGPDKINPCAQILVASVGMFRNRKPPSAGLLIVDEAHRIAAQTYQDLIAAMPEARVLGLTATPERLDGKPLGDTFDDMLVMAEPLELIADGYIAKPVCYGLPREKAAALTRGVKTKKVDYSNKQLGRAMSHHVLMGDLVQECGRLAPGQATIVFAVNREHGRGLLSRFEQAGRAVEYLDGETPDDDRQGILARLDSGETEVVVNVDVLSEGFDCPRVKCIVLARPTRSLTRFLQQVGRACRVFEGRTPMVLDHAGNCWRFGLPDAPRSWTLDGREVEAVGGAAVKHCPECGHLCAAGATICDACGAALPRDRKELTEHDVMLEKLHAKRSAIEEALRKLAKSRGLGEEWVAQALRQAS